MLKNNKKNEKYNTKSNQNRYNNRPKKPEISDVLKLDGIVKDIFPGQKFQVEFENGHKAIGSLSGKLMINSIMLYEGDTVACEIPVDNINICKIVYRKRSNKVKVV